MSPDATRTCPDCGAPNALDAETCAECNHPIDPFARRVSAAAPLPRPGGERDVPVSALPGAPTVHEEQGKVIRRRQHARAGLFGIGSEARTHAGAGGAPGWIWAAVGMVALLITLGTAIGITNHGPKIAIEGADQAKLATADSLARILKKNPNDVQANVEMGNVYYDTKNFSDAIGYYDKALAKDSSLVDVSVDRAVAIHQAGRPDEAVADLEAIIAKHPDHPIARFDLAVIYEFQGRKADAEEQYRQAAAHATSPEVQHVATMRLKALEGTMPTPPPQP